MALCCIISEKKQDIGRKSHFSIRRVLEAPYSNTEYRSKYRHCVFEWRKLVRQRVKEVEECRQLNPII